MSENNKNNLQNLKSLADKFQKRIWIILVISLVIGVLGFIKFNNNDSYLVSTGINLELSGLTGDVNNQTNPEATKDGASSLKDNIIWSEAQNNQVYIPTKGYLNKYFYNQLSSIRIQKIILDKLGEKVSNGAEKKLIYDLVDNNSGYIVINYSTGSQTTSQNFNEILKDVVTNNILPEWNQGKSLKYQAQAVVTNKPEIITQSVSPQLKIIPFIVSLIVTSLIAILVPAKNN